MLEIIKSISEASSLVKKLKRLKGSLGFVPTMGSLHKGHISLVEKSISENRVTVISIFVNPTQFNEKQDYISYPRSLEDDLEILNEYPVDLVFVPDEAGIYPSPDRRVFDFGRLDNIMEGKYRPGHFNGVAQVVSRLFEIISPDRAYFGEKDFQQLAIIRKMVEQLKIPVEIVGCLIIREADGLAMSSRNRLLSDSDRKSASRIPEAMKRVRDQAGGVPIPQLIENTLKYLHEDPRLETEYFEIVNGKSFEPITDRGLKGPARACIAVKIGKVRLIDNMNISF